MTRNTKISIALVGAFVVVIAAIALLSSGGDTDDERLAAATATSATPSEATTSAEDKPVKAPDVVVNKDQRLLGSKGSTKVTFTEFLDFECEACGAAFPSVEKLRKEYKGRVTFQVRYFPIDSHKNARNAAHAVEAAAQQGKFEEMYVRMYETQTEWSEQQESKAAVFRSYAEDMGLNMEQYDKDVASAKTKARVERDVQAGKELGVQGTPTFFINEEQVQAESFDDVRKALVSALSS